jgi:hypothetical protein
MFVHRDFLRVELKKDYDKSYYKFCIVRYVFEHEKGVPLLAHLICL